MERGDMSVIKDDAPKKITHKALVRKTALWLKNNYRSTLKCPIVIAELVTANHEIPDVLGFRHGFSILIEAKVSRNDFLSDKKKYFRREPDVGMGENRYFIAPKDMIAPDELPDKWGLLEYHESGRIKIKAEPENMKADKRAEIRMLTSAIRRLEISTAVFVSEEPAPPKHEW